MHPLMNHSPARPGSVALYQQVKDFIARNITSGAWPPGHRLPSENELVAQFG